MSALSLLHRDERTLARAAGRSVRCQQQTLLPTWTVLGQPLGILNIARLSSSSRQRIAGGFAPMDLNGHMRKTLDFAETLLVG
jgi:hypothetical protein